MGTEAAPGGVGERVGAGLETPAEYTDFVDRDRLVSERDADVSVAHDNLVFYLALHGRVPELRPIGDHHAGAALNRLHAGRHDVSCVNVVSWT